MAPTSLVGWPRRVSIVAGLLALAAIGAASPAHAQPAPPPVEDFFRKPQHGNATLSPSGRYLAVVAPVGGRLGLGIIDLETRKAVNSIASGDGDVLWVVWQTDERLILGLGDRQQVAGERPNERGIVAVDRDGGRARRWYVGVQRPIDGTNEVLMTARERSFNVLDVYRFDTLTGARDLLSFDAPGLVSRWVIDFDGVPRAAVTSDLDGDASAWYVRKSDKHPWTKVEEAKLGRLDSVPMQFDPTGKVLFVSARRDGADRASIYEYSLEDGRWSKATFSHPERDIDSSNAAFIADYRDRSLLG